MGKKSPCIGRTLGGVSRPKTVKIWLNWPILTFFDIYPQSRIILGSVGQEIIGIVKKDPYNHNRKKLPLKKHPERKKVLKIAESTIFLLFLAFTPSAMSMTFSE